MSYSDFPEMPVWQLAFDQLLKIYPVTKAFPADECFGLISDIRRSANSITHNIAEGFGRFESKDKSRFYKISRGTGYELMSQILAGEASSYLPEMEKSGLENSIREVISELNVIIKTLESQPKP